MKLEGTKIVVTEDEPDQLDFIVTVLEDAGANVRAAHNGNQALNLAESEHPDLVTLDIDMPGKDIFQVVEEFQLNGFREGLRICIISGRPERSPTFLEQLQAEAATWGKLIGTAYGEPFTCREPLGMSSMRGLI